MYHKLQYDCSSTKNVTLFVIQQKCSVTFIIRGMTSLNGEIVIKGVVYAMLHTAMYLKIFRSNYSYF